MKVVYSIVLILLIVGCGTVASVQPLGRGNKAVTLSSGGPVAPVFDIDMPIPYSVLRYRQGLSETVDLHAGIHPTMMVMGNMVLDLGATRHFAAPQGWRPGISIEGSLCAFYHLSDFSTVRVFPELGLIGHYLFGRNTRLLYFGIQSMYQYTSPYVIFAPLLGAQLTFGRFMVNIETKWYAPTERSDNRVVEYTIIPANTGAIGFVWGLSYKF